jgi:hypothetical protein
MPVSRTHRSGRNRLAADCRRPVDLKPGDHYLSDSLNRVGNAPRVVMAKRGPLGKRFNIHGDKEREGPQAIVTLPR